jgi:hypothetical protein
MRVSCTGALAACSVPENRTDRARARSRLRAGRSFAHGVFRSLLVTVGLAGLPRLAASSDGNLPRTPMLYPDGPCMLVVDRDRDPEARLDYTIPFSDTCVGPNEPEGSRTHRHVALCRSPEPWEPLPHWLAPSDVASALETGALAPDERPSDEDVMTSSSWASCHALVGALEDRNPIHCTRALEGIAWDTRELPPGAWVLAGYTYHPPMNMWTLRPGVVKIVDGSADAPPAVAVHRHAAYAGNDRPLQIRACVDAQPGSTVHVAVAAFGSEPSPWIELVSTQADDGKGELDLDLDLTEAFDRATAFALRVEARDPAGRTFAYVSPDPITYVAGPAPDDASPSDYDFCEEPHALQAQDCPPGTTPSIEIDPPDQETGCTGCRAGWSGLDTLAGFMVCLGVLLRRRSGSAPAR